MKRYRLCALLLLLLPVTAAAQKNLDVALGLRTGFTLAELRYDIAANTAGCCPNVLSELRFDDLYAAHGELDLKLTLAEHWRLQGRAGYGQIFSGENRDSDYAGNNRSQEISRSDNEAEGDELLSGSLALGYALHLPGGRLKVSLTPLLGYAVDVQNLRITQGYQSIPATGAFPRLDSLYQTQWQGPWTGLEMDLRIGQRVSLGLAYAYHQVDYSAQAQWNLRSDLAHPLSFEHQADGRGQQLDVGLRVQMITRPAFALGLGAHLRVEAWEAQAGRVTEYRADGSTVFSRLNQVDYKAMSVSSGVDLRF